MASGEPACGNSLVVGGGGWGWRGEVCPWEETCRAAGLVLEPTQPWFGCVTLSLRLLVGKISGLYQLVSKGPVNS